MTGESLCHQCQWGALKSIENNTSSPTSQNGESPSGSNSKVRNTNRISAKFIAKLVIVIIFIGAIFVALQITTEVTTLSVGVACLITVIIAVHSVEGKRLDLTFAVLISSVFGFFAVAGSTTAIKFSLSPATVSGDLYDRNNGQNTANVTLILVDVNGDTHYTNTDHNGMYQFPNIPVGEYSISSGVHELVTGEVQSGFQRVLTSEQNLSIAIELTPTMMPTGTDAPEQPTNTATPTTLPTETNTPDLPPTVVQIDLEYYINDAFRQRVNVRVCALVTCYRQTALDPGTVIDVIEIVPGGLVSGSDSNLWYKFAWDGTYLYVHSSLVKSR